MYNLFFKYDKIMKNFNIKRGIMMLEILELVGNINNLWGQAGEILEILIGIYFLVGGILALVQCFFGYKLIKIWVGLIGVVFGGGLAFILGLALSGGNGAVLYLIIGGIIGGFIGFKVYLIGVFLIGVLGGILTALILGSMMGLGTIIIGLAFILGIAGGIAVLILQKPAIIITTSIGAGIQLILIITLLFENQILGILLGGLIMIIGMWYQFTNGKMKKSLVSEVAITTIPVEQEEPKQLVDPNQQATVHAQASKKSIDWDKLRVGVEVGVKQLNVVMKQCLVYIAQGSKQLLEGIKKLEVKEKFKKGIAFLSKPDVKKRCLLVGGIVMGSIVIFVIGRGIYKDSLKYQIPDQSVLEEMAEQKLYAEGKFINDLAIEKMDKKNRKTYYLSLKGSYVEGSVQMLGNYSSEYTYQNEKWNMSVPKFEQAERVRISAYLSEDRVAQGLYDVLDKKIPQEVEGVTQITSQDIQIDTDEMNYKALCTFNMELIKGVQGYETKGTVEYSIGQNNEWEMVEASLKFELIEKGLYQSPDKKAIKHTLQTYGVKLGVDKEIVYYNEKDLTVENAKFVKVDGKWQADCQVKVNNVYTSGEFTVNIPYQFENDSLVENAYEPLEVTKSNLTPLEGSIQPINKEELITFWKEAYTLHLEDEKQQRTIAYNLSEDVKVSIGNRIMVDLTGEDEKVMVAYPVKLVTKENEVEFWINVPYKQVFDEMVIQYRLATYTNTNVTIYPITEERLKEDLKGRYLDMEAETKKVSRYTDEGVVEVQIKEKLEEDDQATYTIVAKFQVQEESNLKEYVGEYEVNYRKDELAYRLSDIHFID